MQRRSCSDEDLGIWLGMPYHPYGTLAHAFFRKSEKRLMHVDGPVVQRLCSKHAYGSAGVLLSCVLLLPTLLQDYRAVGRSSTSQDTVIDLCRCFLVRLMRPVAAVNKKRKGRSGHTCTYESCCFAARIIIPQIVYDWTVYKFVMLTCATCRCAISQGPFGQTAPCL